MSRKGNESLAARYPIIRAFGNNPRRVAPEDEPTATFDQRIESAWMFLVRRAIVFANTLKPLERANFDIGDTMSELYLVLREKDASWTTERGRYITYAGAIASRHFAEIRDRSRTIESPRNSTTRMKEYQREEDSGALTGRRAKTFDDIKRTSGEFATVEEDSAEDGKRSDDLAAVAERDRLVKSAIGTAIMAMEPFEAQVVGDSMGLWGREPLTIGEIAAKTGRSKDAVKKAKDRGLRTAKIALISIGHPIATGN